MHGTQGKYHLQEAWDAGANELADAVEGGFMSWLERWGDLDA
jgi:hypothetical protein